MVGPLNPQVCQWEERKPNNQNIQREPISTKVGNKITNNVVALMPSREYSLQKIHNNIHSTRNQHQQTTY